MITPERMKGYQFKFDDNTARKLEVLAKENHTNNKSLTLRILISEEYKRLTRRK